MGSNKSLLLPFLNLQVWCEGINALTPPFPPYFGNNNNILKYHTTKFINNTNQILYHFTIYISTMIKNI